MPRPDPFDPADSKSSARTWIFSLETFFLASGIPTGEHNFRIHFAATLLRGIAVEWWRQVCSLPRATNQYGVVATVAASGSSACGVDTLPTTWDEFASALTARFGFAEPTERARRELSELRQTGSIQSYMHEFLSLANRIDDLSPTEIKSRFYEGLSRGLQRDVDRARCTTVHEMMQVAERMDVPRTGQQHFRGGQQYNRRGVPDRASGGMQKSPV